MEGLELELESRARGCEILQQYYTVQRTRTGKAQRGPTGRT